MIIADARLGRLLAAVLAVTLTLPLAAATATAASSLDADLVATLELPRGDVDFPLELGTLHFFDEENAPFVVQVIDGCGVNDHLWVFGAGLAGITASLTVEDQRSGERRTLTLPAYRPGEAIEAVFDPEALSSCRDVASGGLPELKGTATYASATPACPDFSDGFELFSEGRDDAYRLFIRGAVERSRISGSKPAVVVDEDGGFDELHLLVEGRTPRQVEGIVFSGREGMLPARAKLDRALRSLTRARVRRAFETAKNRRVPRGIIADLGLRRVECVHHVSLEFDTLGAAAWLAEAGWIREGGVPLEPPRPVPERFTVDIISVGGVFTRLPLTGPLEGSDAEGLLWEYETDSVKVQIIDACALSGSFWVVAAAEVEQPVELVITDPVTDDTATQVLWTDRASISRLADTATLRACPD